MPFTLERIEAKCDGPGCSNNALGTVEELNWSGWRSKEYLDGRPHLNLVYSIKVGHNVAICPRCVHQDNWKHEPQSLPTPA